MSQTSPNTYSSPQRPRKLAQTTYTRRSKRGSSSGNGVIATTPPRNAGSVEEVENKEESDEITVSPAARIRFGVDGSEGEADNKGVEKRKRISTKEAEDDDSKDDGSSRGDGSPTERTRLKRTKTTEEKTETVIDAPFAQNRETMHSSSPLPEVPSPRTPPPVSRSEVTAGIHTPRTPPRDLSSIYRAVSPSPRAPGRHERTYSSGGVENVMATPRSGTKSIDKSAASAKGRRKMLTRTESFGKEAIENERDVTASPMARARQGSLDPNATPRQNRNISTGITFGGDLSPLPGTPSRSRIAPSTPSRSISSARSLQNVLSPSRLGRTPSKTPLDVSHSLSIPSSPSRFPHSPSQFPHSPSRFAHSPIVSESGSRSSSQAPSSGGNRPPRKTYGQSRSFVTDQNGENDLLVGLSSFNKMTKGEDIFTKPSAPKKSYAERRKEWGVDMDEEVEGMGASSLNLALHVPKMPQSNAERRSTGDNKAFTNELTYMLEGLSNVSGQGSKESDAAANRKSSALSVVDKLVDDDWFHKLKTFGQIEPVFEAFTDGAAFDDQTTSLATLLFLTRLKRSGDVLNNLITTHSEAILTFLSRGIESDIFTFTTTPAKGKALANQLKELQQLATLITESEGAESPVNALGLACDLLNSAISVCMDAGMDIAHEIESYRVVQLLSKVLVKEMTNDESVFGTRDADLTVVQPCLSTLHTCIQEWSWAKIPLENRPGGLPSALVDLYAKTHSEEFVDKVAEGELIRSEVLKIILNLTTHSAAWPNALADRKKTFHQLSDSIWMDQTTEDDSARECLCLQLGVLFNILQKAKEEAKQRLVDTSSSRTCSRSGKCETTCTCHQREGVLVQLGKLFEEHDGMRDDPQARFITGYLSLLFNQVFTLEGAKQQIFKHIKGDSDVNKTDRLIDGLVSFQSYYSTFQKNLKQTVKAALEEAGDMNGDDVAQEIAEDGSAQLVTDAMRHLKEVREEMVL